MMFQSELMNVEMPGASSAPAIQDLFDFELFPADDVAGHVQASNITNMNMAVEIDDKINVNNVEMDDILSYFDSPMYTTENMSSLMTSSGPNSPDSSGSVYSSSSSSLGEEENENPQQLIEEIEDFLDKHEEEEKETKPQFDDVIEAEEILEAFMKGNIASADGSHKNSHKNIIKQLNSVANTHGNISNISQIVTETGEKVVIVVAKDDVVKEMCKKKAECQMESRITKDNNGRGKRGAKTGIKRGPYKRSNHSNIADKRERKKIQNVEAARRYRDKMKSQQSSAEVEEEEVKKKNQQLKSKLKDTETELKMLRKLMVELGLIKIN